MGGSETEKPGEEYANWKAPETGKQMPDHERERAKIDPDLLNRIDRAADSLKRSNAVLEAKKLGERIRETKNPKERALLSYERDMYNRITEGQPAEGITEQEKANYRLLMKERQTMTPEQQAEAQRQVDSLNVS